MRGHLSGTYLHLRTAEQEMAPNPTSSVFCLRYPNRLDSIDAESCLTQQGVQVLVPMQFSSVLFRASWAPDIICAAYWLWERAYCLLSWPMA
jgi:hypothetical protein